MEKPMRLLGGVVTFDAFNGSARFVGNRRTLALHPQLPFRGRHLFVDVHRVGPTAIGRVSIDAIVIGQNAGALAASGELPAAIFRCDALRVRMPEIVEHMKRGRPIAINFPEEDERLPLTIDMPQAMPGVTIVVGVLLSVAPVQTDSIDVSIALAGFADE